MKVYFTDTTKVSFDEIKVGECFMYGGDVFMRTTECQNAAGRQLNAVNIATGRMMTFAGRADDEDCDLVSVVDAKIRVSVKQIDGEEDS